MNRRQFLTTTSATAICSSAMGIEPIARSRPALMKLSLAAFSFKSHLQDYRKANSKKGSMDMLGFLDFCADQKIDGAEITSYFLPQPCPDALAIEIKRQAHLLGIDLSGGAIGNNFSFPDGPALDKEFAYTEEWIKTYAKMGIPVIRVFGGKPNSSMDAKTAEENIIRNIQKASDIAAQYGVMLAMENHDFLTDIDRFLRVIKAVNSPWFGANLDSANLKKTADPYADVARIAPFAVNAQIKAMIPVNGIEEKADFSRLLKILDDARYRGYVVFEYEEKEDPNIAVPPLLDELKKGLAALS